MNKKLKLLAILISIFTVSAWAQKPILIEDLKNERLKSSGGENIQKEYATFSSAFDLRSKKRVGLGVGLGGQMGAVGAFAELNFGIADSTLIGFGTGGGYNSLMLQWKHVFQAERITPYLTLGYSRWFSGGQNGPVSQASPSFFYQKFLNDQERTTGKFGKDFFIPSAGLQFYLLQGKYVGASIYTEAMILISPNNFDSVTTGTLGMIFYF